MNSALMMLVDENKIKLLSHAHGPLPYPTSRNTKHLKPIV